MYRIGQGIDVHQFADKRKLILGGVQVPAERGLLGHSDADVLVHAVMDALLGATGNGDIGKHFPDSDSAYKDADSLMLLQKVREIISAYTVLNIDAVIIAQEPKLQPYFKQMSANIARVIQISEEQVNIKATTTEWLGFTGRKEGIVATAVVMVKKI